MNNEKVTSSTQEKSDNKLRIDFHESNETDFSSTWLKHHSYKKKPVTCTLGGLGFYYTHSLQVFLRCGTNFWCYVALKVKGSYTNCTRLEEIK